MHSFKAALAASVCLLPLPALAQSDDSFDIADKPAAVAAPVQTSDNWINLGAQYQSGKSWFLNRYSGTQDKGLHGLADFQYRGRDPWDSGGTNYWDLEGSNLGFKDRSLSAKFGSQGTWGVTLSYDGLPYLGSNDFQTIYNNDGSTVVAPGSLGVNYVNLVPATGSPGAKPPTGNFGLWYPVAAGAVPLRNQNLYLQRDVFKGTGKYQWGDWTISGAIRHEHKDGYQAGAVEIGGGPGVTSSGSTKVPVPSQAVSFTSAMAYFAQPIDYDTDRYDLTAAYATERLQAQLGYTYSKFTDSNGVFNAQNPFALVASGFGSPAGGVGTITAPWVQAPSNSANQVRAIVGYNFSPTTRLTANVQYGLQLQNAPYSLGSGDPLLTLSEPRSSFSGKAETLDGNLALTAQPMDHLDVRLAYGVNQYSNKSPSNAYQVNTRSNTSTSGNGDCTFSTGLCVNLPYSYTHQTFTAEAGYRILPQTKIMLSDTYDTMRRTFSDSSLVSTNIMTAKVRSSLMDDLFGSLSYSHQNRVAHNYTVGASWTAMGTGLGAPPEADPTGFMLFSEASRVRDELKGELDLSSFQNVNLSLFGKVAADIYPNGTYGLRSNHNMSIGPDVSWQVSPAVSAHAYYTYQQLFFDTTSLWSASPVSGVNIPVTWNQKTQDSEQTFGVSVDWEAIKDVLKFGFDYNFSHGDTAYTLGDGVVTYLGTITSPTFASAVSMQALPNVTSTLNAISLHGEYTFSPKMAVLFGYTYEKFDYKDFMYSAGNTSYGNVLMPGSLVPNATVQTVGASLRIRF